METKSKANICKYWIEEEPNQCSYWNSSSAKCTYSPSGDVDSYPNKYPHCNLIGTSSACNKYNGNGTSSRCVLPDVTRGGMDIKTGKKWVTYEDGAWDFSSITAYGSSGECDSADTDEDGEKIGTGEGLSVRCSGYTPGNMIFGPYLKEQPFDFLVTNTRAHCSMCYWWKGSVVELKSVKTVVKDDDGNVIEQSFNFEEFESQCESTDGLTQEYKEGFRDSETGIMSLPCNGAKPECPGYTGMVWKYCVDSKMKPGDKILAEQVQELRYYMRKSGWSSTLLNLYFGNEEAEIHSWAGFDKQTITVLPDGDIDYEISAVKVSLDGETGNSPFASFKLKHEDKKLTKNKTSEKNVDFPTLIEELTYRFCPVILNKFDKIEAGKGSGESQNKSLLDDNEINIFETTDIEHDFIDIIGECKFYESNPIAINLSILKEKNFPREILEYSCTREIENTLGKEKYKEFYNKLDKVLEIYTYYKLDEVFTSIISDRGGAFIIPVKTKWKENDIVVFDKGSGIWEYDKITIRKIFYGAVIAQTEFNVTPAAAKRTIDYLPFYKTSFCGEENMGGLENNYSVKFELKSYGHEDVYVDHVYNDYTIYSKNETEGGAEEYEAGYKVYKKIIKENYILSYDDGNIIPVGTSGLLMLRIENTGYIVGDTSVERKIHNLYGGFIINDEDDIDKLRLKVCVKKETIDGGSIEKSFEVKIFRKGLPNMLFNHIIVEPVYESFWGVGPGTTITIDSLTTYEKHSFGEKPTGTYEETDYIKNYGENPESVPKDLVACNDYMELNLEKENSYELTNISDQTMLISIVYKSHLTRKILGVVRTKMITWVRQPTCRDVQLIYTWNAEYEEFDMVPLQYFRFEQIGFLEKPAFDAQIHVAQTMGYGDFMGYPYTFFPAQATYLMDPDVLEVGDLFYPLVIEYYRDTKPSEVEIEYKKKGKFEFVKTIKQKEPENLSLDPATIEHGYFDMRRLCPSKHNVTIWLQVRAGGYISFCLSNSLPANLNMLGPPEFDGSAMIVAGVSAGVYGHHQQELDMSISEGKNTPFNIEHCLGRFGGGTREVMESYRSIDNLCYGEKDTEVKIEAFKDLIAFEQFKNNNVSKEEFKEDGKSGGRYPLRQWLPTFDTFSNWGLNNDLLGGVFETYTFDLESPYYHPFSVYLIDQIDGVDVGENFSFKGGDTTSEQTSPYGRYTFDEVFETHKFEYEFPSFKYAVGLMYPNLSVDTGEGEQVRDYNTPNDSWWTFKELEQGKQIQWAWKDLISPVRRLSVNISAKRLYEDYINASFFKTSINPPFVNDGGDCVGRFVFFEYEHPTYIYDDLLHQHKIVCDQGEQKIKVLINKEATDVDIVFVQLNDGPPRAFSKNGWDPEAMLGLNVTVDNFTMDELYDLYNICTKDPWVPITLFNTGCVSIEEQDAKDEGRYFQLSNQDVFHHTGLDLEVDFENLTYLPSEESLIASNDYEYLFTESPNQELTKSCYASIEVNEWYPNNGYCYNVVYSIDECTQFYLNYNLFFGQSDESLYLTKMIFIFDTGLEIGETKVIRTANGNKITKKVLNLYHTPEIEITTGRYENGMNSNFNLFAKTENKVIATIVGGSSVEEYKLVFKTPVNLLDVDKKIDNIKIDFELKLTQEELSNINITEEDEKKYIINHLVKLKCVYLYTSKLIDGVEDIETFEEKFIVSTGDCGDFYPDKFEVSTLEESYLKYQDNHGRIITLNQIDNWEGMIGYSNSDGECTSMSKSRGRLMDKVQYEEMKAFEGGNIESYEREQVKLYNNAVNKGDTFFAMNSTAPPSLNDELNKIDLTFPSWVCNFTNRATRKLTPLLEVEPITPEGYYFDWGLDNIIKRACFARLGSAGNNSGKLLKGVMDNYVIDCFDGYKLKSYYDDGAIVGSITDEVWASNTYRASRISVQDRERNDRDSGEGGLTGWNKNRLAGGVSVDTQEKTRRSESIELQQRQYNERNVLETEQEQDIAELESEHATNTSKLEDDYRDSLSDLGYVVGYPAKIEERNKFIDEYYSEKRELDLGNYNALYAKKVVHIDAYYNLLTSQAREAESSPANTDKITTMGSGLRDREIAFLKAQDMEQLSLEKSQKHELIEFEMEHNKKIDKEMNVIQRQAAIKEYKEAEESFEEDQRDELDQLNQEQQEESDDFYEDFFPTEHIKTIYYDLYGDFLAVEEDEDLLDVDEIRADVQSSQEELEDYGKGSMFEIQREAFYLKNKEEIADEILPHPILGYYIPDLT